MSKVTIKDIASQAGVAYQTVSKILNNQAPTVSDETKQKVFSIAKRLNYQPNFLAQSLRGGKTNIIGITFSGLNQLMRFKDPYLSDIYNGVGERLSDKNYKLIFHSVRSNGSSDQSVELAQKGVIDGLIYILFSAALDSFNDHIYDHLKSLSRPVVLIHSSTQGYKFPSVGSDFGNIGYKAAEHLAQHGYKTMGLVMPYLRFAIYNDFLDGFKKALANYSIPFNEKLVIGGEGNEIQRGYHEAEKLLASGTELPRAFVMVSDGIAYGFMRKFREEGIRVPEDVAILAYSDTTDYRYRDTNLSIVSQAAQLKGEKAAEMLLQMIDNPMQTADTRPLLPDPVFTFRESCGCPRQPLKTDI